MSRRRQKNSLLPKMIVVAVLVNAILLPILAQFGVFKAIRGQRLESVKLIELPPQKKPPTPKTAKKPPQKKRVAKAKPHAPVRQAARPQSSRPTRPNPNLPKVVASSGGSGAGGPTVEQGTQPGGQLPGTGTAPPANPAPPPPTPPVAPTPTPTAPTPPPPVPTPKTEVTPPAPPPAPPHVPIVVAAQPLSQPQPKVPDDLSYDDIHGDFRALFSVRPDGTATVQMVSSTGNPTLDGLALDAARHWTFRPATVDGRPVESKLRLQIQFEPT